MGLLDLLFGGREKPAAEDDELAAAIIDRIVAATDKRLALVSGYRETLREGALSTLAHLREIALALPGPVDVGAAAWARDRSLRPLLARADDAPRVFSGSREVRAFFRDSVAECCFALLAFKHAERHVLAPAVSGDGIRQDVARTAVSFDHPRVLAPAEHLKSLRIDVGKRMIDFLALEAMARITSITDERKALEAERALLKVRLQLCEGGGHGLAGLADHAEHKAVDPAALRRDLDANAAALAAHSPAGLMKDLLGIVRGVLADSAAHLRLETRTLALDAMNFVVEPPETPDFTVAIADLWVNGRGPFTTLVARFPRADLLPERDLAADAEKFL
jgi:hypothetical protein